ncbi:uncharacterized protein LOC132607071 isoform X4 [Lycium barbarum]|uniref:uncharacterized protein LOC132049544 isoform X2 n=1 Tax=Lycium ferocissimum TaxID=112874 RepID=UPI002815DD4C|nr:uncharacterized protein LOC132049544 isoform X2 [Lycium ferocissimum]XP_060176854.1 uncharacterized protein LOC132607070 isoform X2 [Lycium barbarum]XP_060176860.1 uncharacterized protein LOC132607071 isoform X4 [Lycium barbarum]
MGDSSAQYIHLVHHLIEECLLFNMSREECMEALSKHANIQPVITSTVWKELEKENKEFFETYKRKHKEEGSSTSNNTKSQMEITRQRINNLLLDSSYSNDHKE